MDFDRSGNFRGVITQYGVKEFDSGALAISIQVDVHDWFNPESGEWEDWRQYEMSGAGDIFVGKKDGKVNDLAIKSLVEHAGWPGDLKSVDDGSWKPTPCAFSVNGDEYRGKIKFKVGFINAYDSTPGGNTSNVTSNRIAELQTKFGSQIRAVASTVKRNATPPATPAPAAPPPKAVDNSPPPKDEIPF